MSDFNIDYVAELSRIALSADEKKKYAAELDKILGYVAQLNECDVSKAEPMSHVFDVEDVFKEDQVIPSEAFKLILKHAPAKEGTYFKVPKIIEGSE